MKTEFETPVPALVASPARTPERWLLVGPDAAWCERAVATLNQRADSLTKPSFLGWRLAHGLIRVVPMIEVNAELTRVLSNPQGVATKRNATRVWAAVTAEDWYEQTRDCQELQKSSARGLNVTLMSADHSDKSIDALDDFAQAADAPDSLPRLTWLMNDRPMPMPSAWLCLAPLSELNDAQNAAMSNAGLRCYTDWAEDVLASSDPDELQALWGPYPDDETSTSEEDSEGDKVVDIAVKRDQRTSTVPPPRWKYPSDRLAASGITSGGFDDLLPPVKEWQLVPTVSRGANVLKAFCLLRKAPEENLPRVEFVAVWNDRRKLDTKPEDLCMVLTLSKRKPVLIKGEPDRNNPLQVRFKWPSSRWSEDMPNRPQDIKRWLIDHLPKARVSLQ